MNLEVFKLLYIKLNVLMLTSKLLKHHSCIVIVFLNRICSIKPMLLYYNIMQ